jgi:hypothetical protein
VLEMPNLSPTMEKVGKFLINDCREILPSGTKR